MKFFKAVRIARETGKVIRNSDGDRARWVDNHLEWVNPSDIAVAVYDCHLDDNWEVETPPPKEYTFAEAYQMMKAGKWMESATGYQRMHCNGIWCVANVDVSIGLRPHNFSSYEIDSKWIEVQP